MVTVVRQRGIRLIKVLILVTATVQICFGSIYYDKKADDHSDKEADNDKDKLEETTSTGTDSGGLKEDNSTTDEICRDISFLGVRVPCCNDAFCSNEHTGCYCDPECVVLQDCCLESYFEKVSRNESEILGVMREPRAWYREYFKGERSEYTSLLLFAEYSECVKIQIRSNLTAIRVITTCPDDESLDTTVWSKLCTSNDNSVKDKTPVSLTKKNTIQIVFRNVYCALCHGFSEAEVSKWDIQAVCPYETNLLVGGSTDFLLNLASSKCVIQYITPPNLGSIRICFTSNITFQGCDGNGSQTSAACKAYNAPIELINMAEDLPKQYKNPHCAICERDENTTNIALKPDCIKPTISTDNTNTLTNADLNKIFNFNWNSNTFSLQSKSKCGKKEVFYPDKGKCAYLLCPHSFKPSHGTCVDDNNAVYNQTYNLPRIKHQTENDKIFIRAFLPSARSAGFVQLLHESCRSDQRECIDIKLFVNNINVYLNCCENSIPIKYTGPALLRSISLIRDMTTVRPWNFDRVTIVFENFENESLLYCEEDYLSLEWHEDVELEKDVNDVFMTSSSSVKLSIDVCRFRVNWIFNRYGLDAAVCRNKNISLNCSLLSYTPGEYKVSGGKVHVHQSVFPVYDIRQGIAYVCQQDVNPPPDFIGILSLITLSLSIASLLCVLMLHCKFPVLRNLHGKNIMSFSASLMAAQVLHLLAFHIRGVPCFIVAFLQHYGWLCSFAWSAVMSYDLASRFGANKIMKNLHDIRAWSVFVRYALFAYGVPLVIVLVFVALDVTEAIPALRYGDHDGFCWIGDERMSLFGFGVPVGLCIVFNIVCFFITLHGIETTKNASKIVRKEKRNYCIIYTKISMMLGLTWTIGYVHAWFPITPLMYSNIILNGLQGLFIFIGVVLNGRVINMIRSKLKERRYDVPSDNSNGVIKTGSTYT